MSKQSYIVNCYTCQHNGQETCKGCNTFLNGESEPYENWQLREDLETKDQRMAELEEQLKNAIVPKFRIGQEVYKVYTPNQKYPFEFKIIGFKITKSKGEDNIFYNVEEDGFDMGWYPDEILFATREEAQAKLEELKGEEVWTYG